MVTRTEPYNVVMDVTPSQAANWLEGNTHNRPVTQAHVERLAAEMSAGRWRLTHQGIAFSTRGVLLDGQHRLARTSCVKDAVPAAKYRVLHTVAPGAEAVMVPRICLTLSQCASFGHVG